MDNVDKLVQLITDRLLENLHHTPKSVLLIGGSKATVDLAEQAGYTVVDTLQLNTEYIVVETSQIDALLRVASLCPTTPEESIIVSGLLQGKHVCILNSALQVEEYKKTATPLLYRELLNQKQKLEKYGAKFCDTLEFSAVSKEVSVSSGTVINKGKVVKSDKKSKLITEAKLRELDLGEGDVFVAPKGVIVTSLAKDYLKRRKISLENEK